MSSRTTGPSGAGASSRIVLTILLRAPLALALGLLPRGLAAQCDTLTGAVRAGESYEHAFGDGLVFGLRAHVHAPPNPGGWNLEVRAAAGGEHDFAWVATLPYRWWNPRYIDTSYGLSAREAVARDVRSFGFVTGEAAYDSLSRAVELLVSSRPADMTASRFEAARDPARVTWEAMMDRVGQGELRITGAQVSDSTAQRPLGRIERLAFTAVLCPGGDTPPGHGSGGSPPQVGEAARHVLREPRAAQRQGRSTSPSR